MNKDSKLIFENYRTRVLNEQIATPVNPALYAGAQLAGQASPAILGGLAIMINNISKWAYSQTEEGKKAELLKIVEPKISDFNKATSLLDSAIANPSDAKAAFQAFDYSTNVLLSQNESVKIGQIVSKINDIGKSFFQTQTLDSKSLVSLLTQLNSALDDCYRNFINNVAPKFKSDANGQKILDFLTKAFSQTKSEIQVFAEWARSGGIYVPSGSELAPTAAAGAPMPPEDPEDKKRRKEFEADQRAKAKEAADIKLDTLRTDRDMGKERLVQLRKSGERAQKLGNIEIKTANREYITSNGKVIKMIVGLIGLIGLILSLVSWYVTRGVKGMGYDIGVFLSTITLGLGGGLFTGIVKGAEGKGDDDINPATPAATPTRTLSPGDD